jgi:hypothetical protein
MTYDIELGQGDSDEVEKTLTDADGAINLTGATVECIMKNDLGTKRYEIDCTVNSPATAGKITIPFTDTETEFDGLFFYELKVTIAGDQYTFPSCGYGTIYIKKAL